MKLKEYRIKGVNDPQREKDTSVRIESTLAWVNVKHPALDIGEKNILSSKLNIFANTGKMDLNYKWDKIINEGFQTITCFEVIEHLQNPLLFLEEVHRVLKEGGTFYLTTPVRWWMGKGKHHFHEYSIDEMTTLLKMAGFETIQVNRIRAYNLNHFGIRPIIRWLRDIMLGQCMMIICKKIKYTTYDNRTI